MRPVRGLLSVAILSVLLASCASGGGGSDNNSGPGVIVVPDNEPRPGDPIWSRTYKIIQAEAAYKRGLYGRGVTIGIHDNLVKDHPDLTGHNLGQISDGQPTDINEGNQDHGTAVAMTILGRPMGSYLGGVAPSANFYWTNRGSLANYQAMIDKGIDILNVSLASDTFLGQVDFATQVNFLNNSTTGQSYQALFDAGVLVVVSAGNAGNNNVSTLAGARYYRPDLTNWITVVATNGDGNGLASYSNKCGLAKDFCLAAPGEVRLPSATLTSTSDPFTSYRWLGTSFAAPTVTGVAALVKQAFPWMDGSQLAQTLLSTATDIGERGVDPVFGHGMVNADKATLGPAALTAAFKANVTDGYDSVFGNDISGEGNLIKEGDGSLTLAGQNTYTGGTTLSDGTLRLTGSLGSDLIQSGGVFEGQGYINGDYLQQDGLLTLSQSSPLTVTGNAELGEVSFVADGNEYLGAHWDGTLLNAGSLSGETSLANTSIFYDGALRTEGGTLFVEATRQSGEAAIAGSTDQSTQMGARGLDAAFALTDAQGTAQQQALLAPFQGLDLSAAGNLDSLAGQAHASARSIALEAGEIQQRWIDARVREATFSEQGGFWAMGGTQSGTIRPADAFDAQVRTQSFAAGADRTVGADDQWLIGASVLGGRIETDFERFGGEVESEQRGAGLYGAWRNDGTIVRGHVSYSELNNDVKRSIVAGNPVSQNVQSDTEASLITAGLAIEQSMTPQISLFAGIEHDQVRSDAFSEQGLTGFELQANASSTSRTRAGVGVRFQDATIQSDGWHWDGSIGYYHLLNKADTGFDASYTAFSGATFRIEGMESANHALWLGGGLSYRAGSNQFILRGDVRQDGTGRSEGWSIGYRRNW